MTAAVCISEPGFDDLDRQFVTFYVAGNYFGVALAEVQEIIRFPQLLRVPLAHPFVLGLANLRGTALPVASLRRILDLEDSDAHTDSMRVIVLKRSMMIGILVDRMSGVLTADLGDIESADGIFHHPGENLIEKIVKDGNRRVMICDPARVLDDICVEALSANDGHKSYIPSEVGDSAPGGYRKVPPEGEQAEAGELENQYVSFTVDDQEYALPIDRVREIVTLPEVVTAVHKASPNIVGVISLRENLLPLMSVREILGCAPCAFDAVTQRVVVTTHPQTNETHLGLVVDTVKEVLRVPKGLAEDVPPAVEGSSKCVEAMLRVRDDRIVSVLAVDNITYDFEGDEELNRGPEVEAKGGNLLEEQFVIFRIAEEDFGVPVEVVQEIVRIPEQITVVPKAPDFVVGVINLRGEMLPMSYTKHKAPSPSSYPTSALCCYLPLTAQFASLPSGKCP